MKKISQTSLFWSSNKDTNSQMTPVIAVDSEQQLPSKKAVLPPRFKDLNCSTNTDEGRSPEEVETETNDRITRQCHQENLQ